MLKEPAFRDKARGIKPGIAASFVTKKPRRAEPGEAFVQFQSDDIESLRNWPGDPCERLARAAPSVTGP